MVRFLYAGAMLVFGVSLFTYFLLYGTFNSAAKAFRLHQDGFRPKSVVEGDAITVVMTVDNPLDQALTLTDFRVSCGCIDAHIDGQPLKPGFVFPSQSKVPVQILWDTEGRFGDLTGGLSLTVRSGTQEEHIANAVFGAHVFGKMRAMPTAFAFSESEELSPHVHRVFLCDGHPNSAWEINSIRSSSDSIQGTLKMVDESTLGVDVLSEELVPKYVYEFSFEPETYELSEQQSITFNVRRQGCVEDVTLQSVVDWTGQAEQFYSTRIAYFDNTAPAGRSRNILLRSRRPIAERFHVLSKPAFINVSIAQKDDYSALIQISLNESKAASIGEHRIDLSDGKDLWCLTAIVEGASMKE